MKYSAFDLLRDAWDRFLLYLPLGVMALLALGTYWLVRGTPQLDAPGPVAKASDAADYTMEDFSVKTFDAQGRLRSEVLGAQMRHFPNTQFTEVDDIRVRSVDSDGRITTASAQRGLSNEDGSEVQLFGNAVVVREAQVSNKGERLPRVVYRSEFLHAFMNTEQIRSHKPVELTRGNDHFTADRLDYDNLQGTAVLQGRVKGTLFPETER